VAHLLESPVEQGGLGRWTVGGRCLDSGMSSTYVRATRRARRVPRRDRVRRPDLPHDEREAGPAGWAVPRDRPCPSGARAAPAGPAARHRVRLPPRAGPGQGPAAPPAWSSRSTTTRWSPMSKGRGSPRPLPATASPHAKPGGWPARQGSSPWCSAARASSSTRRKKRLFDDNQRIALELRYKTCTEPACTVPAAFTEAHHSTPWSRGGRTDLADGRLLCGASTTEHITLTGGRPITPTAPPASTVANGNEQASPRHLTTGGQPAQRAGRSFGCGRVRTCREPCPLGDAVVRFVQPGGDPTAARSNSVARAWRS
jgi:hypothetical protein